MSWLFSQALVAEYSAATLWDGAPSAQLSVMPTPHPFWRNDKMMDASQLSRFGVTCALLTEGRGAALLTWFQAGFRARTSALPVAALESTASAQASGRTWPASLAKFDPATHSLKTAQLSLLGDSTECSATLPRWGSMRSGELYQRPTAAPLTCAKEFGLWPTPTVCGNHNRKGASKSSGDGLATAVAMSLTTTCSADTAAPTAKARMFPTPVATMHKGWSSGHNRANSDDRIDYMVEREASQDGQSGRLNPQWVEWLMGWPIGWTDLKPLEMARFREWQRQHSPFFPGKSEAA